MDWFTAPDYWLGRFIFQRGLAWSTWSRSWRRSTSSARCSASAACCPCPASSLGSPSGGRRACSTSTTPTASSRRGGVSGSCSPRPGGRPAAGWPLWLDDALLARAVGAVPVDRQRRADLLRLRLGVAAAGGRLPGDLPRQRTGRRPRSWCCWPASLAAVPGRVRRRADQAARRSVLARPDLPGLPPRDPADARPAELVLPPPARGRCTGSRWSANHVAQLVVPFLLFAAAAGRERRGAAHASSPSCGWSSSGNFAWLNWVTIVLAVAAVRDAFLGRAACRARRRRSRRAAALVHGGACSRVTALVVVLSYWPVRNLLPRGRL